MNKLYQKNCIEIIKEIKDETIDLIVTDPPYKTTSRGTSGTMGRLLERKEC